MLSGFSCAINQGNDAAADTHNGNFAEKTGRSTGKKKESGKHFPTPFTNCFDIKSLNIGIILTIVPMRLSYHLYVERDWPLLANLHNICSGKVG